VPSEKSASAADGDASVTLSSDRVPLGSPIDITYKFVVANDASFKQDYRVMVHVVDPNEELMWTTITIRQCRRRDGTRADDRVHAYGVRAGVPVRGEATIQIGLYAQPNQPRVHSPATTWGSERTRSPGCSWLLRARPYFGLQEGWHPAEQAEHNPMVEWHWTKKVAILAVRNPKRDSILYLDVDNRAVSSKSRSR